MNKSKKDPAFEEVFKMAVKLGISPKELEYSLNKLSNAGISSTKAGEELIRTINNHLRRKSMKRELILDEVKYDGEYYSTKILKQTHRGLKFTPDGTKYKKPFFTIASYAEPELINFTLCVRGVKPYADDNTVKTKDKSVIDKALATVKAYNEEFGCDENLKLLGRTLLKLRGKLQTISVRCLVVWKTVAAKSL